MSDVDGISQPELGGSSEEYVPNPLDHVLLLTLSDIHHLQQPPIALPQIQDISKDIIDELFQFFRR